MNVDVCYNLGDAINKIGFGLVVWNLARAQGKVRAVPRPDAEANVLRARANASIDNSG